MVRAEITSEDGCEGAGVAVGALGRVAVGVDLCRMTAVAAPERARTGRFSKVAALRRAEPVAYPARVFCRDASNAVLPKAVGAAALAADDAGDGNGVVALRSQTRVISRYAANQRAIRARAVAPAGVSTGRVRVALLQAVPSRIGGEVREVASVRARASALDVAAPCGVSA